MKSLGIKLTDGMYDDGNIQYLKSYQPEKKLKSNITLIIHQLDMLTTRIEYELNMKLEREEEQKTKQSVEKIKSLFLQKKSQNNFHKNLKTYLTNYLEKSHDC